MSDTIPRGDLVTADILSALSGVATANGYQTTVSQIAFWTPFGLHPDYAQTIIVDNGIGLFEGDIDPIEASPNERFDYWQPYYLQLYAFEPASSMYRARKRLQIFRADVIRALQTDYQRGGNAHDTQITGWGYIVDTSQPPTMQIDFKCRIREDLTNPLTLR